MGADRVPAAKPPRRADGRPRCEDRAVLNGILWMLRSGARWQDLPARFPSYQTCPWRFQGWVRDVTLARVLQALAEDVQERGGLDLSECFIAGPFIVAKKGAAPCAGTSGAGRWSGSSPGWATSGGWWSGMNIMPPTISASSTSAVSSSCSVSIFETASRHSRFSVSLQ